jgi:hypothetical protein
LRFLAGILRALNEDVKKILRYIALGFMAAPLAYAAYAAAAGTSHMDPVQRRADRVFAFDQAHPRELPGHHVRALSVALAFHDEEGARALTVALEKIIVSQKGAAAPLPAR